MDREQKRRQRVQLRCLKKLDKKEEKLLEPQKPSLIAQKAGKLVQGTPVIGVYGGFRNGVLLRQVGSMAAVKYQQRRLREMR